MIDVVPLHTPIGGGLITRGMYDAIGRIAFPLGTVAEIDLKTLVGQ
jgi:hypothetical protein